MKNIWERLFLILEQRHCSSIFIVDFEHEHAHSVWYHSVILINIWLKVNMFVHLFLIIIFISLIIKDGVFLACVIPKNCYKFVIYRWFFCHWKSLWQSNIKDEASEKKIINDYFRKNLHLKFWLCSEYTFDMFTLNSIHMRSNCNITFILSRNISNKAWLSTTLSLTHWNQFSHSNMLVSFLHFILLVITRKIW